MSTPYKPEDFSTVSPYLIVDGASATIDFLVTVFGAVELRRFADASGRVMHADVRIEDTVVMLGDANAAAGWPPRPACVHVYVRDVDAIYHRALAAGATRYKNRSSGMTRTSAAVSKIPAVPPGSLRPRWSSRAPICKAPRADYVDGRC